MVRFIATFTIIASLLAASSEAFTPVVVGSKSSFIPQNNVVATPVSPRSSSSSTALNMNLFDRFSRVAKSNLNNILKNLEDPEKIMSQALEDMQVRVIAISVCVAHHAIRLKREEIVSYNFCNLGKRNLQCFPAGSDAFLVLK